MILHVIGGKKSGKSTVVRRVMLGYEKDVPVHGFTTGAVGHDLSGKAGSLHVFGNYLDVGRVPYGLSQFDRRTDDFKKALENVVQIATKTTVLMEGGLARCRPFLLGENRYIAQVRLVVIGKLTDWSQKFADHLLCLGAIVHWCADAEKAYQVVCREIGIEPTEQMPKESWR